MGSVGSGVAVQSVEIALIRWYRMGIRYAGR
jgi:hypothetical protein